MALSVGRVGGDVAGGAFQRVAVVGVEDVVFCFRSGGGGGGAGEGGGFFGGVGCGGAGKEGGEGGGEGEVGGSGGGGGWGFHFFCWLWGKWCGIGWREWAT